MFDRISETIDEPPERRAEQDPGDLTPLTDEEYLGVFDDLVVRYKRLATAYRWGMVTAVTPEQEQQLAELRELLDE